MIKIKGSLGLIYLGAKQKTDADKYNNHKSGSESNELRLHLGSSMKWGGFIKENVPEMISLPLELKVIVNI